MNKDFGTVRPGSTLYVEFDSFGASGESLTLTGLAATDIEVYKNGGTTQRASDNGYTLLDTDGIDFDALTGIHGFSINLADNSTAGFWESGAHYRVVVSSVTINSQTVSFTACTFRIGYANAIINTSIATLSTQTSFTLTSGPAEDDALNGMCAIIHDVASAVQLSCVQIADYVGSTKTVTLVAGATFTVAATDNISIMGPYPLQPTTTGRTLDVSSTGEAGLDWANVGSPTATVNLSGTTVKTATDVETDTADIQSRLPAALVSGRIDASVGAMAANVLTATAINADAITAAKIADGAIDAATFAAGAINAAAIASDAVTEIRSLVSGTADSGSTTTMVDAARTEADADYWSENHLIVFTSGTIAGQARVITGFDPATDTITFAPATTQAVGTNTYEIWPITDALRPTIYGRTLDVTATGAAGVDWANVENQSTAVNLSATNIDVDQVVASVTGAVGSVTGAVGSIASGGIAAASFAAGAINAAAIATDAIDADALADGAITAATFSAGAIDNAAFNVTETLTANPAAGGIVAASFGAGAIDAAAIATGAIDADAIASGAITSAKFAADAITSTVLAQSAADKIVESVSGTADSGTTTTLVDAARTETDTDYWKGAVLLMTSGNLAGQRRRITAFTPGTDTITVDVAFTQAVSTHTYTILRTAYAESPAAGSGDWTAAEKEQIRDALGVDGTKTAATGGDVQDIQSRLPAALVGGRMDSNVGAISADSTAADNAEAFFDGTGYAGTNNVIPTVTSVTGNVGGNVTGSVGSLGAQAKLDVNAEADTALADVGVTTTVTGRIDVAVSTRLASASYTAPLDAAGTRTAVGLASANLDTQLDALPTAAENAAATLDAALTEPSGMFAWASATPRAILRVLGALMRNKVVSDSNSVDVKNDADNATLWTYSASDDGTTYTSGEGT